MSAMEKPCNLPVEANTDLVECAVNASVSIPNCFRACLIQRATVAAYMELYSFLKEISNGSASFVFATRRYFQVLLKGTYWAQFLRFKGVQCLQWT